MNFTAIFCFYVLLPYFASIVSPPQEAITCYAVRPVLSTFLSQCFPLQSNNGENEEIEIPVKRKLRIPRVPMDDNYFVQIGDHFHFTNSNTWNQRYLIYDHHYGNNGAIFLRIGTDDDITPWNMQNGSWFDYCKKAKALCVGIELRGYGLSLPNGNLKDENLKYISSDQALADVAWFIFNFRSQHPKYELPKKLKWVVHGKGKQGTLAAWLRMKYPHLVNAAFSLSAPVLAKIDYDDYFKLIVKEMLNVELIFKKEIREAYKQIDEKIETNKFRELIQFFSFCDTNSFGEAKNKDANIEFMYFIFSHTVATIMQYGKDDLEFMKKKAYNMMVKREDKSKDKDKSGAITKFAKVMTQMLKIFNQACLQINLQIAINKYKTKSDSGYNNLVYLMTEIFGNRTTLYQNCNEFGQFETLHQFFGPDIGIRFYTEFCSAVFANQYYPIGQLEKGVRRTNLFYGGLDIEVSNVIFVYGDTDPYRKLGMIYGNPANTVTYFLRDARHCYDLDHAKVDPRDLNEIKDNIFNQLINWIQLTLDTVNNEDDHVIHTDGYETDSE